MCTESMVVVSNALRRNRILNRHIYCRQFLFIISSPGHTYAGKRDVLIQSPATRTMVYHDITDRVTAK